MKQNKETLKQFFETGDKPTQQQYADLIDSYIDAKQPEGEANRRFVIDETGEVNVASEQEIPEYTLSDIVNNKLSLLKDGVVVKEIDLTIYIDDTNLARLVSGSVDTNGIATFTRDDSTIFTVDLSNLKEDTTHFARLNEANGFLEEQTIQVSGTTSVVDTLNLNTFGNSGLGRGTGVLFNIPGAASTVKGGRIAVLGDGGGAMTFSTSPDYLNSEPIERFRIESDGSFDFKSGKASYGGNIELKNDSSITPEVEFNSVFNGNTYSNTIKSVNGIQYISVTNETQNQESSWLFSSNGLLRPYSNNTHDLGHTNFRWRNIFTNDIDVKDQIKISGVLANKLNLERTDSDANISVKFQGDTLTRYFGVSHGELYISPTSGLASGNLIWHSGNFVPNDYLQLSGGDLTGNLTTIGDLYVGSDSGFANSKFYVNKDSSDGSNTIGTFTTTDNTYSGSNSNYTYGNITRTQFSGTGTTGEVWGAQMIARNNGSGISGTLIGSYGLADLEGTASASNMYGALGYSTIQGTGSANVTTALGAWNKVEMNNSNSTTANIYGSYSNIDLKGGTVTGQATALFLDYDYTAANAANVNVNNLYYIKADADVLPAVTGEAYFIKSDVALPSKLNGELETASYKVSTLNTAPNSVSDTGKLGEIRYTNDYIYVCVATDTWKRTPLTTW